jgi:hypothetical protein
LGRGGELEDINGRMNEWKEKTNILLGGIPLNWHKNEYP